MRWDVDGKKSRPEISIYLSAALTCRHEAAVQRRCCVLVRRDARLAHARRRTDDLRPIRRARFLLPRGQRPCRFSPSGDAGAELSSEGRAAGTRPAMVRRGPQPRHRLSHPAGRGARARRTSGTRGSGRPSHVLPTRPGQAALGDVVHRGPGTWTCRDSDEDASRSCRRCVGRRFERDHARHQPSTASPCRARAAHRRGAGYPRWSCGRWAAYSTWWSGRHTASCESLSKRCLNSWPCAGWPTNLPDSSRHRQRDSTPKSPRSGESAAAECRWIG